jgi:hypothetical protein
MSNSRVRERLGGLTSSAGALLLGVAAHAVATRALVPGAALAPGTFAAALLALALLAAGAALARPRAEHFAPLTLAAWGGFLVASAMAQIAPALAAPWDLVSFAESPYVNDVIKWTQGAPLYGPAGDNDSYPYPPGAQIATHFLASLWGAADSVAGLRITNFVYVLAAVLLAWSAAKRIAASAGRALPDAHWTGFALAALFMAATEPSFNRYVHSLHNDSLALLVSACGFWLLSRERDQLSPLQFAATLLLPALGFFVKQSMLVWLGLFALARFLGGFGFWRAAIGGALSAALAGAVIYASIRAGGEHYTYWLFGALGDKQVSPGRSLLHFLAVSPWAAVGAAGLWAMWGASWSATPKLVRAAGVTWAVMLSIQAWTSGIGWVVNHLGPAVVIAAALALAALPGAFPRFAAALSARYGAFAATALLALACVWLHLLRIPSPPAPPHALAEHAAAIEREFAGLEPESVLLDNGSWIYQRHGLVMKDRSSPLALHAGENQPINHAAIAPTISRIESGVYAKILVHDIDPRPGLQTWYDYRDRGTGVKQAISARYELARVIPGAAANFPSWMEQLASDVWVYERRPPGVPRTEPN